MMNPVLVPFMAALVSDRNFRHEIQEAVAVYAHGWAESHDSTDADEDGYYSVSPQWPGWKDVLDRLDLEKVIEATLKHSPHLKGLYTEEVKDTLWDDPEVIERAIVKVLPEHQAEELFEEEVRERWAAIEDGKAYDRDPYAYYGLSRRDFLASSPLKRAVIRLAHTKPELRKHLVPLLRGGN